ncbi:MAG: lipoprotein-releasing ABC transporter permease subunit [Pseudomonadota bacterium]
MSIIHKLPYEFQVGLRYTRGGRRSGRNSFISFISFISVFCMTVGVAVLIIVQSVMNGFQKEVTDRMLSVLAHIEIYDANRALPDWQQSSKDALRNKAVVAAAPFVETDGMLINDGVMRPAMIRGVLPLEERKVSDVAGKVTQGSFDQLLPGTFNIVVGQAMAKALDLKVGDKFSIALAQPEAGAQGGMPRVRPFTLVGVFDSGHYEYDSSLVFVHLDDAKVIANIGGPSGLRLRIADMHAAPQVTAELMNSMPGELLMRDWSKQNVLWFAAVRSQKKMLFIILALIVAVASFNLVATLVMSVTDKQADIAILRTLGSSPASIMKIFMVQGVLVGLMGTACGIGLGVLVALNVDVIVPFIERVLQVKFLSQDIYLLSAVPSDLQAPDVIMVAVFGLVLAFVSTLYPSWAASRVRPAEALRYE